MTQKINRWSVMAGSIAILLCTGVIYSFSVFAGPLKAEHGWSMAEIMMAFTINGAIAPSPMILGWIHRQQGGARVSILLGGLLFTTGFILTGMADSLGACFSYGLVAGLGQGFAYSGCLDDTLKLFPDKRGLAAGLITGGMGAGTVMSRSPSFRNARRFHGIRREMVRVHRDRDRRVISSRWPPSVTRPTAGRHRRPPAVARSTWTVAPPPHLPPHLQRDLGGRRVLPDWDGSPPGIPSSVFGLTAATAAGFVSLYSACNALGQLRLGRGLRPARLRRRDHDDLRGGGALRMLVLVTLNGKTAFAVGIIGLGLCFGGVMGVFPALVILKNFGPRHQGINYGITFCAYSVSAYFAPRIAANISGSIHGDYTIGFVIAMVLVGVLLTLAFVMVQRAGERGHAHRAQRRAQAADPPLTPNGARQEPCTRRPHAPRAGAPWRRRHQPRGCRRPPPEPGQGQRHDRRPAPRSISAGQSAHVNQRTSIGEGQHRLDRGPGRERLRRPIDAFEREGGDQLLQRHPLSSRDLGRTGTKDRGFESPSVRPHQPAAGEHEVDVDRHCRSRTTAHRPPSAPRTEAGEGSHQHLGVPEAPPRHPVPGLP